MSGKDGSTKRRPRPGIRIREGINEGYRFHTRRKIRDGIQGQRRPTTGEERGKRAEETFGRECQQGFQRSSTVRGEEIRARGSKERFGAERRQRVGKDRRQQRERFLSFAEGQRR